mmetsp:Transcript_31449/g.85347  ORF Transcript_31449/g.85347 Transcript_31449/m.85347 type:complete len:229 (-) Transcript_31449:396-1082(-)
MSAAEMQSRYDWPPSAKQQQCLFTASASILGALTAPIPRECPLRADCLREHCDPSVLVLFMMRSPSTSLSVVHLTALADVTDSRFERMGTTSPLPNLTTGGAASRESSSDFLPTSFSIASICCLCMAWRRSSLPASSLATRPASSLSRPLKDCSPSPSGPFASDWSRGAFASRVPLPSSMPKELGLSCSTNLDRRCSACWNCWTMASVRSVRRTRCLSIMSSMCTNSS